MYTQLNWIEPISYLTKSEMLCLCPISLLTTHLFFFVWRFFWKIDHKLFRRRIISINSDIKIHFRTKSEPVKSKYISVHVYISLRHYRKLKGEHYAVIFVTKIYQYLSFRALYNGWIIWTKRTKYWEVTNLNELFQLKIYVKLCLFFSEIDLIFQTYENKT